jgi:hypothetical protein
MKALSVRQPWGHLLVHGLKTVEVRKWSTDYRGRLLIHASGKRDEDASRRFGLDGLPVGVLLGFVDLLKVEEFTPVSWELLADEHLCVGPFAPCYAWTIGNPEPLSTPVPMKGSLGLFNVDITELVNVETTTQLK